MARIALGITVALLLVTCFFGFQTWNKVQGLNLDLANTKATLKSTQTELAATKTKLQSAQDELAKTKDELQTTQAQLATTQSNLDAANKQVADLNSQIDTLNKKIASMTPTPQGVTPTAGPSQADYDALNTKYKDSQAQVAELTQLKETLTNKVKDAESRADDLQKVVDHYKNNILKNGLEGQVLAVNQGWNFVVLSIGDRQGAVANGEMILKRGDEQIGKVRITSVEPSTSVADIIPGSLARGVRVEPGDRVIFQGN
jgi:peptidoglycan hydrolase CwlO-like protein